MARIEALDVIPADALHQLPEVAGIGRRHQQVDVVVHQDLRMQLAGGLVQGLGQQVQVEQPVVVIEKAWEPVVAALDHMLRNAGECDARKSCHDEECGDGTSVLQSVDTAALCGVSEPDPVMAPTCIPLKLNDMNESRHHV